MGIFSASSPFDSYVERATSEKNTSDDWSLIIDVCDRVKESQNGPKDCLKSISKRLNNDNPRVVLQAITLLDACIYNCGRKFLLEVAGREFEQDLHKLITSTRTHPKVSQRLRESLKKWSESEFKGDPELSLIPALYTKLQNEGYDFDVSSDSPKKTVKYSSDPNVVHSAQEEEDIAKAIQLSLQESGSRNSYKSSSPGASSRNASLGLYSGASAVLASEATGSSSAPEKEPMKVRALYDFEAAEDNELTFKAGEIIIVLDNSDANWWKGTNHRGKGYFQLISSRPIWMETSSTSDSSSGKRVSFSESVEVTEVEDAPSDTAEEATGEIDEDKINQLLHLLHEADPSGERSDDPSIPGLEEQVNAMAPSIDAELECIDKKHMQLARISTDLVDALNLYHQLMREMPSSLPYYSPYSKMMPNSGTGPQNMIPLHFLPSNPQNVPQHQMYPPNHYPSFVGPPVSGMPPYFPHPVGPAGVQSPPGHMGSPSHHQGIPHPPPTSSYHPLPNHGPAGGFNSVAHDYPGMPNEQMQNNMVAPPSPASSSQAPTTSVPSQHQNFPQTITAQGHPIAMPPASQSNQTPQGPPVSMPLQGHPHSMPPQGVTAVPQPPQGPAASMPHLGPTTFPPPPPPQALSTSIHQEAPASMAFYSQPQMTSMPQQPLL